MRIRKKEMFRGIIMEGNKWIITILGLIAMLILGSFAIPITGGETRANEFDKKYTDPADDVAYMTDTSSDYPEIDILSIETVDNGVDEVVGTMVLATTVDTTSTYYFEIGDADDWDNTIEGTYSYGIGMITYADDSTVYTGVTAADDTITWIFDRAELDGITNFEIYGSTLTYSGIELWVDWAGYDEDNGNGGNGGNGVEPGDWTFAFTDNDVNIAGPSMEGYEGTFTLDTSKSPKEIDIVITDNSIDPSYNGETSVGIYKLNGDKLTISMSEPGETVRPTTYTDEGNNMVWQLTLLSGDTGATELEGIWTGDEKYETELPDEKDDDSGGSKKKDDDGGFLPGFEAVIVLAAFGIAMAVAGTTWRKHH